ncbi:MAG: hypothetical protein WBD20_11485 [Pirellulaceae bacterium]
MPLRRSTLIFIAKWLIAVVVAVGLFWAARKALNQWQEQTDAIEASIIDLDRSIESTSEITLKNEQIAQRDALRRSVPSLQNLSWSRILISTLLYTAGIFVPGLVLHQALDSLGEHPRRGLTVAAQLLGHAGKYVPGKAMVIVLRAGALARDDVAPMRATIAVFMETLLMMAVGAALACAVICWLPVPTWMLWTAILVAIVASVPTIPPILTRVAAKVSKTDVAALENRQESPNRTLRFFLIGWSLSLVSWLLIGASFCMLVTAIPSSIPSAVPMGDTTILDVGFDGKEPSTMMLCAVSTAAIGLGMVVGFASLLPGGAGVRELVLTTILSTAVGMAHALLAAVAARLMFIAVEAICAGLAWCWLRNK